MMPNPPTLLDQVEELERIQALAYPAAMLSSDTITKLCRKLREVVEALTSVLNHHNAFNSPGYDVAKNALTPMNMKER